jgi:T5SS/PEP-CTERM-associated repeat protein
VNLASSGARLDLVSGYLSTGTVVLGAGSFNWTAGTVNLSSGSAGVNIGTTNSLPGAESIGSGKALIATGHLTLGGGLGVGSLNVSGGGHLLAPLYVDGGSVLGDGTNSLMICAAPSVSDIPTIGGSHGDGTLTIQNGAALLTDDFNIGGAATASGTVLLSGAGTIWGVATATSDAVTSIGYDGTGYVQLSGGAVFSQGVGVHNVVTIIGSHAGSRGTLIVDGAGSSWLMSPTSNNSQLSIGLEGSGNLSVLNGASLSCGGGMVGAGSFGTGTVAVNGMGSRWINTRSLSIGESGTGTLSVLSGATASAQSSSYVGDLPASHGTVLIDGNGSALSLAQDLYVGNQGAGAVTVSGGGSISFRGGLAGAGSLGTGTAIVTGLGSQWTNTASLSIGESGTGALSILAGATASVQSSSYVGDLPASHGTVLVDGNGSGLNIAQDLYVGNRGAGTVTISGGGSLSCAHAYIGSGTAGIGLVVLQDPGSNWTCSSIDIGQGQAGTLSVSPGAAVSVSGTINVWPGGEISDNNGSISAGFINLQTGTFSGVGTLAAGISNTNGTIDVPGGTLNLLNSVTNTNLSTLTKTGAGTVVMANLSQAGNGSLLVSNGAVNLVTDLGPGLPSVNVSVTQPGGAINFGATQHLLALNVNAGHAALTSGGAKVLVTRSLSINSAAGQLDLANGAMILDYPGPVSPISTVKSWFATGYASGSWSGNGIVSSTAATMPRAALGYAEAIDLFSTFPASFFGQSVDNTSILIRYTLAGDANLDGTVNTLDFNSLAANFSLGGRVWRNGDFNYDGVANALDFNAIASNFGQTLSGAPLGTVVPEPAYCMTLLLAALLTARHRRHQIYARNSPWSAS